MSNKIIKNLMMVNKQYNTLGLIMCGLLLGIIEGCSDWKYEIGIERTKLQTQIALCELYELDPTLRTHMRKVSEEYLLRNKEK